MAMRITDIVHDSGRRLRVGLDRSGDETMILQLSDPLSPCEPVLLDLYGSELLAGFVMNARLTAGGFLREERCGGLFGCRLRLLSGAGAAIELVQHRSRLLVPDVLWDRLYAELTLALAHGRHASALAISHAPVTNARTRLLH
jgi:hypothetical protein